MKTTLDLPDELIRAVKLHAVLHRRTVKDLVAEFIRKGLGMAPSDGPTKRSPSPMVQIDENGIPSIRCFSTAAAIQMSTEELLALEQQTQTEEDLHRAGLPL